MIEEALQIPKGACAKGLRVDWRALSTFAEFRLPARSRCFSRSRIRAEVEDDGAPTLLPRKARDGQTLLQTLLEDRPTGELDRKARVRRQPERYVSSSPCAAVDARRDIDARGEAAAGARPARADEAGLHRRCGRPSPPRRASRRQSSSATRSRRRARACRRCLPSDQAIAAGRKTCATAEALISTSSITRRPRPRRPRPRRRAPARGRSARVDRGRAGRGRAGRVAGRRRRQRSR